MPKKTESDEVRKMLEEASEEEAVSVSFRQDSIVATIGEDLKAQLSAFAEATGQKCQAIVRTALEEFFKGKDVDSFMKEALIRRLEKAGVTLEDLEKFQAEHK